MLTATKLAPDNEVFMNTINHHLRSFQSIMIQTFSEVYFKELQEAGRSQFNMSKNFVHIEVICYSINPAVASLNWLCFRYQSRQ